jgi:hypothetical protein
MKKLISIIVAVSTITAFIISAKAEETLKLPFQHAEMSDALAILREVVGLDNDACLLFHDFNGNGEIDIEDALIVLRGIIGLEERVLLGVFHVENIDAKSADEWWSSRLRPFAVVKEENLLPLFENYFSIVDENIIHWLHEYDYAIETVERGYDVETPVGQINIIPESRFESFEIERLKLEERISAIISADEIDKLELDTTFWIVDPSDNITPLELTDELLETRDADLIYRWVELIKKMEFEPVYLELIIGERTRYGLTFYVNNSPVRLGSMNAQGYFSAGVSFVIKNYPELQDEIQALELETGFSRARPAPDHTHNP